MRDYFDQVSAAAQSNQLYFLALSGALVIPDMCSAMEQSDGRATRERYIAWFDRHVAPKYTGSMTGDDCYGLRCALLHQGRLGPHRGSYSRVLFVEPGSTGITMHNNVIDDALNIDVRVFVDDVVSSAYAWLSTAEQTPEYVANFPNFMQRYPLGLPPYIGGVPVIA